MMKSALTALSLCILFAGPALAEHHRAHARAHLEDAMSWMETALMFRDLYANNASDDEMPALDRLEVYGEKYARFLLEADEDLADMSVDLEEARGWLSSPALPGNGSGAITGIASLITTASLLVKPTATDFPKIRKIQTLLRFALDKASAALWHINDAVREEVYQDRQFICNGPGNHSATDPICD